ncbi:disease resistance protein RPM1-like isoform X2 [Castanea sativa]|uniref:disease resistance protein RPM1-like isoform X2 n=1 Tax=Castanea sativa TaxID=21020 RepID=UPI003F653207
MESAIAELLIDNIISTLATEASLLWGVRDAIEDIDRELTSMQSFLQEADKRGASSAVEKTWVTNVRNTAYDVEDVIDMFMYHINSQQIGGRFAWFLHHTIYIPQTLWVRHKIACKLQNINKTIKRTSELKERYRGDPIEGKSSEDFHKWVVRHAQSSLFFKEDELVGIEDKRKQLIMRLMDREQQQTVISILGMGGSGKTTLVANIYNSDVVQKHFDCYAWITVSQKYGVEDLLRSMIEKFYESKKETNPSDLSSKDYISLGKMLESYLEKKSYLLVLDDVWNTNVLNELRLSLQDGDPGSKIILTTRKDDVSHHRFMGEPYVHRIQLLEPDEAWELFCKKAFLGSPNRICPPELESVAHELVRKCEGLPLAIVALGSLMYSKNDFQWSEIRNTLNSSLSNNPDLEVVKSILLLSFNELPYQLKHCFLYCSLFPEDHEIRRKRLIKLWMAEGFVKKFEGRLLEEVADNYLGELTFRNMLQVVRWNESGRPQRYKMHDILRDLALSISVKEKFGVVHDGAEEMKECKARRISIHKTDGEFKSFTAKGDLIRQIRSMTQLTSIGIGNVKEVDETDLCISIQNMRRLRVLTIIVADEEETLRMDALSNPPDLRNLILCGKLERVPQWFRSLRSLTFLQLDWSRLIEDLLPHISTLPLLGHLILTNAYVGNQLCFNTGFCKLTKLGICNFPQLNEIIIEKDVMPNLETLNIDSCKELKTVPKGIEYLQNLQELHLISVSMELINRICNMDLLKVQHIPKRYIWK